MSAHLSVADVTANSQSGPDRAHEFSVYTYSHLIALRQNPGLAAPFVCLDICENGLQEYGLLFLSPEERKEPHFLLLDNSKVEEGLMFHAKIERGVAEKTRKVILKDFNSYYKEINPRGKKGVGFGAAVSQLILKMPRKFMVNEPGQHGTRAVKRAVDTGDESCKRTKMATAAADDDFQAPKKGHPSMDKENIGLGNAVMSSGVPPSLSSAVLPFKMPQNKPGNKKPVVEVGTAKKQHFAGPAGTYDKTEKKKKKTNTTGTGTKPKESGTNTGTKPKKSAEPVAGLTEKAKAVPGTSKKPDRRRSPSPVSSIASSGSLRSTSSSTRKGEPKKRSFSDNSEASSVPSHASERSHVSRTPPSPATCSTKQFYAASGEHDDDLSGEDLSQITAPERRLETQLGPTAVDLKRARRNLTRNVSESDGLDTDNNAKYREIQAQGNGQDELEIMDGEEDEDEQEVDAAGQEEHNEGADEEEEEEDDGDEEDDDIETVRAATAPAPGVYGKAGRDASIFATKSAPPNTAPAQLRASRPLQPSRNANSHAAAEERRNRARPAIHDARHRPKYHDCDQCESCKDLQLDTLGRVIAIEGLLAGTINNLVKMSEAIYVKTGNIKGEVSRIKERQDFLRVDMKEMHSSFRLQHAVTVNVREQDLQDLLPCNTLEDAIKVFDNKLYSNGVFAMATALKKDDYIVSNLCAMLFTREFMCTNSYPSLRGKSNKPRVTEQLRLFVDRYSSHFLNDRFDLHKRMAHAFSRAATNFKDLGRLRAARKAAKQRVKRDTSKNVRLERSVATTRTALLSDDLTPSGKAAKEDSLETTMGELARSQNKTCKDKSTFFDLTERINVIIAANKRAGIQQPQDDDEDSLPDEFGGGSMSLIDNDITFVLDNDETNEADGADRAGEDEHMDADTNDDAILDRLNRI